MKKIIVGLIIVAIVLIGFVFFSLEKTSEQCCQECLTAFSQSPVAVGPQGARCGTFTTGSPLSTECQDYFSSSPRTVAECPELSEKG